MSSNKEKDAEILNYYTTKLWEKINNTFVTQEDGKTLTSNDFTDEDKANLDKVVSDIGDETLNTEAQTIIGAVNEINTKAGSGGTATKGTELTDILPAGQTTITFTNEEITTDSKLNAVYTSIFDVQLESASFGEGTLTLVFPAQEEDMTVTALINATSTGDDIVAREVMDDLNAHIADTDNPHNVVASQIGIDNSVSGMYASDVQGAIDELKGTIGYSKKNLLKNINTTSAQTKGGITCTPNTDGSFTLNGTCTTDAFFNINYNESNAFDDGEYILSGGTSGAWLEVIIDDNVALRDKGEEVKFTISNTTNNWARIFVDDGTVLNNVTVYPMVRYASIEDNTYVPYVEDVQTKVNRLYDVEKLESEYNDTTPKTNKQYFSYTATKKCLVNASFILGAYSSYPTRGYIYKGQDLISSFANTTSSMTLNCNILLDAGETLMFQGAYNAEAINIVSLNGYVQYLE